MTGLQTNFENWKPKTEGNNIEQYQNNISKNVNNTQEVSLTTRKRVSRPETWKRNILKRKREAGEAYINNKGQYKREKSLKQACVQSCTYKCTSKFSEEQREDIRKSFYKLTDKQKNNFYKEFTVRELTARKRTPKGISRRKFSFQYYFSNGIKKERVCKRFFCSTLDISTRRIYYFHSKFKCI